MADEDADPAGTRTPTLGDLVELCRNLNANQALYLVVGGFAVIQHGYFRTTGDIDLLIEDSMPNQRRVRAALEHLPEKAILELGSEEDLRAWVVLRVADEILVDVMTAACGVDFVAARDSIERVEIGGVSIPFASVRLLLRMKQTVRASDEEDRIFLQWKIAQEGLREK